MDKYQKAMDEWFMREKKPPATLFKYHSPSLQNVLNLKKQSIYYASPDKFNDPFDCVDNHRINFNDNLKSLLAFLGRSIQHPMHADYVKEKMERLLEEGKEGDGYVNEEMTLQTAQDVFRRVINSYTKLNGISCFSEDKDNFLLWSHYAESHQGYCLEFTTEKLPRIPFMKVRYVDQFIELNGTPKKDSVESAVFNFFVEVHRTKSKHWKYEKEWRMMVPNANRLIKYKSEALKAIYFGSMIDESFRDIICLIAKQHFPKAELWHAKLNKDAYQIDFERRE